MSEKSIVANIVKKLRGRGAYVIKIHGGPYQQMGIPDLLVIENGRVFFLEVKRPGEEPSLRQSVEMNRIRLAGVECFVVTSADEVPPPAVRLPPRQEEQVMNLAEVAKAQRAAQIKAERKAAEDARMAEFQAKERELIGDLPTPFFNLVSLLSWEYGHAAGFSEVLVYVEDIGDRVRRALREHTTN